MRTGGYGGAVQHKDAASVDAREAGSGVSCTELLRVRILNDFIRGFLSIRAAQRTRRRSLSAREVDCQHVASFSHRTQWALFGKKSYLVSIFVLELTTATYMYW